MTDFSNRDAAIALLAPGAWLDTSALVGGVTTFGGTSASAPLVAACAAVLRQAKPDATADQLRAALTEPAVPACRGRPRSPAGPPQAARVAALRPRIRPREVGLRSSEHAGLERPRGRRGPVRRRGRASWAEGCGSPATSRLAVFCATHDRVAMPQATRAPCPPMTLLRALGRGEPAAALRCRARRMHLLASGGLALESERRTAIASQAVLHRST